MQMSRPDANAADSLPVVERPGVVPLVGRLVARFEIVRYAAAGGFNTALGFGLYVIGLRAGLPYLVASVVSWCVCVVVAFALQSTVVFRCEPSIRRFLRFAALNTSNLVVSICALSALVGILGADQVAASLVTTVLVVIVNYIAGKFLIFGGYGR